jgi:5-methylcytosine-specific restriction endonuclease McrA
MEYFGYGVEDYIACELCNARAVDIHHISCRGMGGTKKEETIDNLMALCRTCHIDYGDKKDFIDYLKEKHNVKTSRYKSESNLWNKEEGSSEKIF